MERSYARAPESEAPEKVSRAPSAGRRTLTLSLPGCSDAGLVHESALLQRQEAATPPATVQRWMDEALGFVNPVATATAGVANASAPLPHRDAIQTSFGRHDVSGVRAEVGGPAAEAATAIGADAYATGDAVGFRAAPDLFTAAHEAAHVVQQRKGVALRGGVGSAGDPYEQHADRVAEAVVRGESAEPLLDEMAGTGGGPALQKWDATASASKGPLKDMGVGYKSDEKGSSGKFEYQFAPSLPPVSLAPLPAYLKPVVNLKLGFEAGLNYEQPKEENGQAKDGAPPPEVRSGGIDGATVKGTVAVTGGLQIGLGDGAAFGLFGEGALKATVAASATVGDDGLVVTPMEIAIDSVISAGITAMGCTVKTTLDKYQLCKVKVPKLRLSSSPELMGEFDIEAGEDLPRFCQDLLALVAAGPLGFAASKIATWLIDTERKERIQGAIDSMNEFASFWERHRAIYDHIRNRPELSKHLSSAEYNEILHTFRAAWDTPVMREAMMDRAREREEQLLNTVRQRMEAEATAKLPQLELSGFSNAGKDGALP